MDEVYPNVLHVRVNDTDEEGVIYRRDWRWEQRVTQPPFEPKQGDVYPAVYLGRVDGRNRPILSLRAVTDPWQGLESRLEVGMVVSAEIVNVRHFAAFAQVEPGVDGIIRPRDVPFLPQGNVTIASVLAIGDQIQGTITVFDPQKKRLEIDIRRRLQQLSLLEDLRGIYQYDLLSASLNSAAQSRLRRRVSALPERIADDHHPAIHALQRILVLDDTPEEQEDVYNPLGRQLGVEIMFVSNVARAFQVLQTESYGLMLIDYHLDFSEGSPRRGTDVALDVLATYPDLPLIVTTTVLSESILEVGLLAGVVMAQKETKKLAAAIRQLLVEQDELDLTKHERVLPQFVYSLGMEQFAQFSLIDALKMGMNDLQQHESVDRVLLVEFGRKTREGKILAAVPELSTDFKRYTDGTRLDYSPLRDIVEDGQVIDVPDSRVSKVPGLDNLFPTIGYARLYGTPIDIAGMPTRHALLVMGNRAGVLSAETLIAVETCRQRLAVSLEREMLMTYMHRYERRYTLGEMLLSLDHELRNRLGDFSSDMRLLQTEIRRMRYQPPRTIKTDQLEVVHELVEEIDDTRKQFTTLVNSYVREASDVATLVDLNTLVTKIAAQFEYFVWESANLSELPIRRRLNRPNRPMEIRLTLADNLPEAFAITSQLEQVLTNLILNAGQQIEKQRMVMREIAQTRGDHPLLQQGLIMLETRHDPSDEECPLKIIISDSGPGIAWHRQESIFQLDITNRSKGSGMGLYISRGLVEAMGGRLRLISSIMFIGTAFVIELPRRSD